MYQVWVGHGIKASKNSIVKDTGKKNAIHNEHYIVAHQHRGDKAIGMMIKKKTRRWESWFFSLSISANILLLETNAISMPEKKALKIIVRRISNIEDKPTCSTISTTYK